MPSTEQCLFRLHVLCTREEREEAESLALREELGKGSKVLTWIALLAILGMMLTTLYFKVEPEYRPHVFVGFAAIWVFVFIQNRRQQAKAEAALIGLFADEIHIANQPSPSVIRWSAFVAHYESPNLFVLLDRSKTTMLILPKRVFPDAAAIEWFRRRIEHATLEAQLAGPQQPEQPPLREPAPRSVPADAIRLEFRYRYRDFLDRNRSTWLMRAVLGGVITIIIFVFVPLVRKSGSESIHAPYSDVLFALAFAAMMAGTVFFMVVTVEWFNARPYLVLIRITLDGQGLTFQDADVTAPMAWDVYNKHKETHWSFLLWQGIGRNWLLLPKRSFPSAQSIERCRRILRSKTKSSTPWV